MHKILIAEDSFALANLLDFVLKNSGFEVEVHRTGAAASDAIQDRKFDLILLDQQMPRLSGIEVIEILRSSGPNQETPIFLCTAKSHELDHGYLERSLNVSGIFQKPFSPKDLVQELKSTLHPAESC